LSAQQGAPPSVIQAARYFLKAGEVVTRIAVLVSVVYAIYYAVHLAPMALRGAMSLRSAAESLFMAALSLACAGSVSVVLDRWYRESKYRPLGFADLLAGAVALISAPVAGMLFIVGGLLFYVAAETISIFKVEERLP